MTNHPALGLAGVVLAALALAGCSGRDVDLAEKLAAIEAAADRAEKAAERAEKAAKAAESKQVVEMADAEIEPEEEPVDEEPASPEPGSDMPQNGA